MIYLFIVVIMLFLIKKAIDDMWEKINSENDFWKEEYNGQMISIFLMSTISGVLISMVVDKIILYLARVWK